MQFLPIVILSLDLIDELPGVSVFSEVFSKVRLADDKLTVDEFSPGSSGQAKLRNTFELHTRLTNETIWESGRTQGIFKF